MRMNVYEMVYPTGHKISHYSTEMFSKMVNDYNRSNCIPHTMNLNKIRRYSCGASVPPNYTSFKKVPMHQYINLPAKTRLSMVDYRSMFENISAVA